MDNQACCSHSKVNRIPTEYPGGSTGEEWVCLSCNTRFWPEGTDINRMKRRHDFACAALGFMRGDSIVAASIPSLSKAIDRDAAWRKEMIDAVAKSAYDIADAMLAESEKKV